MSTSQIVWDSTSGDDLDSRTRPAELAPNEDEGKALDGRWVYARDLKPGDRLIGRDGQPKPVVGIQTETVANLRVCNLTVEVNRNYAVGISESLVHNVDGCPDQPKGKSQAGSTEKYRNRFDMAFGKAKPKPYRNRRNRPKYAKGQEDEVWDSAKQLDGKVYDPNTGKELEWDPTQPRTRQWNMGHKPGHKYSDLHQDYLDGVITQEEFLEQYRDSNNYWPEDWFENQSHKWE